MDPYKATGIYRFANIIKTEGFEKRRSGPQDFKKKAFTHPADELKAIFGRQLNLELERSVYFFTYRPRDLA